MGNGIMTSFYERARSGLQGVDLLGRDGLWCGEGRRARVGGDGIVVRRSMVPGSLRCLIPCAGGGGWGAAVHSWRASCPLALSRTAREIE